MGRVLSIRCLAADPVPCPETFRGGSERMIAERMLTHLDEVHVHDGGGPSWGLSWRDGSGEQHIGVASPATVGAVTPQHRGILTPEDQARINRALEAQRQSLAAQRVVDAEVRAAVLAAVDHGASVRELAAYTQLSTNTISRWKREK